MPELSDPTKPEFEITHTTAVCIWPGGSGQLWCIRRAQMTLPGRISTLSELLAKWESPGDDSEVILRPQKMYQDPLRRTDHIMVVCDAYTTAGEPGPSNKRHAAARIFSHPDVVAANFWFEVRQEYTLWLTDNKGHVGQGPHDCARVRTIPSHALLAVIVNEHFEACRHAGINITGINGEAISSQYEFQVGQVGSASGISAADDLWAARYILEMIAEMNGVVVSFDPNAIPGSSKDANALIQFSTNPMRKGGGREATTIALEKLWMKFMEDMAAHGEGNESFFAAKNVIQIVRYHDDSVGAEGYIIEDRRPTSNMDPYVVTSKIAETTVIWKPTPLDTLAAMVPFVRWVKNLFSRT